MDFPTIKAYVLIIYSYEKDLIRNGNGMCSENRSILETMPNHMTITFFRFILHPCYSIQIFTE